MKKKISITLSEKTLSEIESIIDNIFIRNRSQAIEHLVSNALGENRTAVILCGGNEKNLELENREYCMCAKAGRTRIIEMSVKKLREEGFRNIFVIARKNVLTSIFEILRDGASFDVKVSYIEEKESGGTADSLRLLQGKINTDFLVVYGDIVLNEINLEELWMQHIKQNAIATLTLTTSSKPSERGTVDVEGSKIIRFTQKPKQSETYLVFSPIFIANQDIFNYSGSSIEKEIFPELAEKGLLQGRLSSKREVHIHSVNDLKKVG